MTGFVTLRPLRADDADAVAAIWEPAWRTSHAALGPAGLDQARDDTWYFAQARGFAGRGMLALIDNAPLGFVTWERNEISRLFVAPEAPRAGIGSTLLAATEFAMATHGVRDAWLHCRVGNDAARRFFERKGWEEQATDQVPMRGVVGEWTVECWRMGKAL